MNDYVKKMIEEYNIEHVVVMYDCTSKLSYKSVDALQKVEKPVNKVDVRLKQVRPDADHVKISCKTGEGIAELMSHLVA
jgi:predicted P-loop ATPase/GTPase